MEARDFSRGRLHDITKGNIDIVTSEELYSTNDDDNENDDYDEEDYLSEPWYFPLKLCPWMAFSGLMDNGIEKIQKSLPLKEY